MDKKQVERQLSWNKLNLSNCGTDGFPSELINVGIFGIGGPSNEDENAIVFAFTKKGAKGKYCSSFLVRVGDSFTYYYRDYFEDVNELIAALRAHNGYKQP